MLKKISLFTLLILITHQPAAYTEQYQVSNQEQEFIETSAKFVLFSAALATCTYAIYKIGSWLFKKSNEQIYQEASHAYHQTKNEYNNLVMIWIQEITYASDEHLLSILPIESTATIYNLGRSLDALKEHIKRIEERLQEFKKSKKNSNALEPRMEKLRSKIKESYKSLKPIHSYLMKHSQYYTLANTVRSLIREFSNEITALENNRNDEQTIHKVLTSHIMSTAKKHRYPYIHYIENLSNKLNQLEKTMQNCERSYPKKEQIAHKIKAQLECIHSLILIHTAYHNELQEQERNRLKEQKIALEKAKVRAQEEQARALQEQNWLRAQEIYNQEKILRKLDKN